MGRISFTDEAGNQVFLGGRVRALSTTMCPRLSYLALVEHCSEADYKTLKECLPPNSYLHNSDNAYFKEHFELWFGSGMSLTGLYIDGEEKNNFTLMLNTVMRIGNDQFKLMARLHGQCELHLWVANDNKQWLSNIINNGLDSGLYKERDGWRTLSTFLTDSSEGDVVSGYSITGGFPQDLTGEHGDDYYDLTYTEQWNISFEQLKERDKPYGFTRELRPDTWDNYLFYDGLSLFDLPQVVLD